MHEIKYTSYINDDDLKEILRLQKANLFSSLLPEEKASQGYVTVQHDFDLLKEMWVYEPGIVAKHGNEVIAYVLTMTANFADSIPLLIPLFDLFDIITYKGKPISSCNYMAVGQICIAKEYRGKGIFDDSYKAFRNLLNTKYDFAITEVATKNLRSLSAHKRVGFEEIHKYVSPTGEEWSVVIWNWK